MYDNQIIVTAENSLNERRLTDETLDGAAEKFTLRR